jgi:hypothetical protein
VAVSGAALIGSACGDSPAPDSLGTDVAANVGVPIGQPCTAGYVCQSGVCDPTTQLCVGLAVGQSCWASFVCQSGLCDPTTQVCLGGQGGARCKLGSDCLTGVCLANGYCSATATCFDGVQNGTETGKDCGGSCAQRCAVGAGCASGHDCVTGVCAAASGLCVAPSCADGVLNGGETDTDCGGPCPGCGDGKKCTTVADCQGNGAGNGTENPVCSATTAGAQAYCRQSTRCTNGLWDSAAGETDVDCGGPCKPCPSPGRACGVDADCASGVCTLGACQAASCQDGRKNGTETGIDCGGAACPACGGGLPCKVGADCASGTCAGSYCTGPLDPCAGAACAAPDACHFASCSQGACQTSPRACQASCQELVLDPALLAHSGAGAPASGGWEMTANGSVSTTVNLTAGQTVVTVTAKGAVSGGVWPHLVVAIDGAPIGSASVSSASYTAYAYPIPSGLSSGAHTLSVAFDNYAKPPAAHDLFLQKVAVGCGGATCSDGIWNGGEAGTDCGGPCSPCPFAQACAGKSCAAPQCGVATCDPGVGACVGQAAADGTACHWGWSERFGNSPFATTQLGGLAAAPSGGIFATGVFYGPGVDFGGGPMSFSGVYDTVLARYDGSGHHVWSKGFGAPGGGCESSGIAADPAGNVVMGGLLWGTADFGGGPLVGGGYFGWHAFVADFDSAGNHRWSKVFGDAVHPSAAMGFTTVATDAAGDVFVGGGFQGDVDFGGGLLHSAGGVDMFVAKFDASGNHLWSRSFGDARDQYTTSLATDAAGNVLLTAVFEGTVVLGAQTLVTSPYSPTTLVAKLDGSGQPVWALPPSGSGIQQSAALAVDAAGNAVVSRGNTVTKLTPNGTALWTSPAAGTGAVAIDAGGNVTVGGGGFLARFDAWGNALAAASLPGTAVGGITVASGSSVYVSGSFQTGADFGAGVLTSNGTDAFLARWGSFGCVSGACVAP